MELNKLQYIVKVGVAVQNTKLLMKIDLERKIEELMADVIGAKQNLDHFSFRCEQPLSGSTHYVTEANKYSVKNGFYLQVQHSPRRHVERILSDLSTEDDEKISSAFEKIAQGSSDLEELQELVKQCGPELVLDILIKHTNNLKFWKSGLIFFYHAYTYRLIPEVPEFIVRKTMSFPYEDPGQQLILTSLRIVAAIRRSGKLPFEEQFIIHVAKYLEQENLEIQTAALRVLNYSVLFTEGKHYAIVFRLVVTEDVIRILRNKVVTKAAKSKELQHELYIFQTFLLNKYEEMAVRRVKGSHTLLRKLKEECDNAAIESQQYQLADEPSNLFRRMTSVFDNLRSAKQNAENIRPKSEEKRAKTPVLTRKMSKSLTTLHFTDFDIGFHKKYRRERRRTQSENDENATEPIYEQDTTLPFAVSYKFPGPINWKVKDNAIDPINTEVEKVRKKKKPTTSLAIANLQYFSQTYKLAFNYWFRPREKYRKSLETAEEISQMICDILEIGRLPRVDDENHLKYQPLVYTSYPKFFEEFFPIVAMFCDKIEREINPKVGSDMPKVFEAAKYLIVFALKSKPSSFTTLKDQLELLSFNVYQELQSTSREKAIQRDLREIPIFLEYRGTRQNDILTLVQQQRLNFISRGQHLPLMSRKGERVRGQYVHLSYSEAGKCLLYGSSKSEKCNKKICRSLLSIDVAGIKTCTTGTDSHFYKEALQVHMVERDMFFRPAIVKQKVLEDKHPFSIEMCDGEVYNFCADTAQHLDYWTDGLNILLDRPTRSLSHDKELQELLDLEVRLHFLEIEGLPIPKDPPPVPPPPSDYIFFSKRKRYEEKKLRKYKEDLVPTMPMLPDLTDYPAILKQRVNDLLRDKYPNMIDN